MVPILQKMILERSVNKIIGLLTAWYAEDWIEPAIEQLLEYCDEAIVSVGYHCAGFKQLKDRTMERALKYRNRVTFVDAICGSRMIDGKCSTLNKMLKNSRLFQPGNWLWLFDVDEFYFEDSYKAIKAAIDTGKYDSMRVSEKYFYINMRRYLLSSHGRLWRIQSDKSGFNPTQAWKENLGNIYTLPVDDKRMGMFHYSLLIDPKYKEMHWKTEYGKEQVIKVRWLKEIYMNYNLKNEEEWVKKNQALTGVRGPLMSDGFKGDDKGHLFIYNGNHPPFIPQKLIDIEDFRRR